MDPFEFCLLDDELTNLIVCCTSPSPIHGNIKWCDQKKQDASFDAWSLTPKAAGLLNRGLLLVDWHVYMSVHMIYMWQVSKSVDVMWVSILSWFSSLINSTISLEEHT